MEPHPSSTTTRELPGATQTDGERALVIDEQAVQVRLARAFYQKVVGGMTSARLTAANCASKHALPAQALCDLPLKFCWKFCLWQTRDPPR